MIKCLIIEDEPLAADLLRDYVRQVPFLDLKGICIDSLQALAFIRVQPIDLLFLDIHLPGLRGLDFIRTLPNPPAVIVTTAYHEYAIQGYELNVVDYLLKPIEFSRFVEAVNKVKSASALFNRRQTISVSVDKKMVVIPVDEIIYIESQKEYIKIQTKTAAYVTKYSLTRMETELSPAQFLRVHRSFIVALAKVNAFNGHEIELPGKTIPIGGNYRASVGEKLRAIFP